MLGVQLQAPEAHAPASTRTERPPMMGGPVPGVPPDTVPPGTMQPLNAARPVAPSKTSSVEPSGSLVPPPRRRAPLFLALLAGVVVLGGTAGALLLRSKPAPEAPLQAQIQSGADGAMGMLVTVPGMPAGTVVRYAEQQQTLDAQGQARFALGSLSSRIGAIDLPIELAPPNAAPQQRTARIVLAWRVEPDLNNLAAERPGLQLLFHVVPGSQLLINDQPVATDRVSGIGAARIDNLAPMPLEGPDTLTSDYNVRVNAPDGTVATGVYQLRVPRTPLLLERPAAGPVTMAADRIVVRGRAPGAARVTVGGTAAELTGDAFTAIAPLPAVGPHVLDVVAYSRSGAPAVSRLTVERVANDRAAATRFLGGATAGTVEWARGGPAVHQRVRVRGRVLGTPREYEGGQTFQLVVSERGCDASRCLLWIDTEPGVTPAPNATLEIVGTVSGRRQAVTAGGERRSDPVIQAAFVF
jgi:hypothetical protein